PCLTRYPYTTLFRSGSEIVKVARPTRRLFDLHGPIWLDLHPHKRNKGVGNLSLVEAPGSQRKGEVVTAVACTGRLVTDAVQLVAAQGTVRVTFFVGVAGDRHHRI